MRAGQIKGAIAAYAEALRGEGCADAADRLERLLRIFQGFTSKPMNKLLAGLDELPVETAASQSETVGTVISSLRNIERIVMAIAPRSVLQDLEALRTRLERHESGTIEGLIKAVEVQRRGKRGGGTMDLEALAAKLKDALGDDERFIPLFEELSKLSAADVARVMDRLMSSGSSGTRKKDLSRLRERHQSLRALDAKERATAGRSAA
jgi:hypothetical protein